MNNYKDNEIKYCTHCGSINKKSAVFCTECEKKIATSYKPFYDFLKNHTKDDISGSVTDTFFSFLKNYLMSHVYGIALSVSIVATAVSTVYAIEPHIERIYDAGGTTSAIEQPQEEIIPLTDNDIQNFEHLTGNYDSFVDLHRSSYSYWETSSDYGSASEMYAENNIEGFSYGGVHEMISNPINVYYLDEDPTYNVDDTDYSYFCQDRYIDTSSATTGEKCTSAIAKSLHSDGYRVAECNYVIYNLASESDGYDFDTHTGATGYEKKLVYKFVFVEHNGKWYIAEDRLVQRVNV